MHLYISKNIGNGIRLGTRLSDNSSGNGIVDGMGAVLPLLFIGGILMAAQESTLFMIILLATPIMIFGIMVNPQMTCWLTVGLTGCCLAVVFWEIALGCSGACIVLAFYNRRKIIKSIRRMDVKYDLFSIHTP